MKIKGNMFSLFVGTAMAVILTIALLLGGCPAGDSATDPSNNGNTTVSPVQQAINELSITYADGDSKDGVTRHVTLPATGKNDAMISWTSSNEEVIATTGEVIRPAVSETVTLTATATIGEDNSTLREFQLMVLSNEDVITRVKETLEIQYAEGDTASSVTQDIVLPATGQFGLTGITWESDDTGTITADGKVSRPAKGANDAEITLTATITLSSATQQTRQFTLTVLALTPTVPGKPVIGTTTPGKSNILVPWIAPDDDGGDAIIKYTVYWGTVSGFTRDTTNSMELSLPATTLELNIDGLEPTTTYYFVVTASNSLGEGEASDERSAATIDAVTAPGKPGNVTARVSGIGEITVSWTTPGSNGGAAITEYTVYWGMSSGFTREATNSKSTTDGSATELVIEQLTQGKEYYFAVTATNSEGEGEVSDEVSAKAADVPDSPTGVSTALTGNGGIAVSWTAPGIDGGSAIMEYRVYWGTTSGFTRDTTDSKSIVDGTAIELIIENLNLGEEYFFVVTAVNAAGESNASTESSITVAAVPDPPTGVTVALTGDGEATVSWTAPVNNGGAVITEYTVYWGTISGFERYEQNRLKTTDGTTTELAIQNLDMDTLYYFVVTATNVAGEGNASIEVPLRTVAVPDSPTDVTAMVSGIGEITVSWSAPDRNVGAEITEYTVYWGTMTGFAQDLTNSKTLTLPATSLELTIDQLTVGEEYFFVVTAKNSVGISDPSAEVSATAATVPDAPTGVSAISTGSGVITVSWKAPTNNGGAPITKYTVYWGTSAGFEQEATNSRDTTDGTATELAIGGLTGGVDYYFRVTASNGAGESDASSEASTSTVSVPGPPTDVTARVTGVGEITVSWKPPVSDGGSEITYYLVCWDPPTADGFSCYKDKYGTRTEYTYTSDNMTPKTLYNFSVRAENAEGEGHASDKISVTAATVPDPPTGISAVDDGNRGITVSWTAPDNGGTDITEYRVYWGTSTGFTPYSTNSQSTTDGTASELTIQNLTLGIPYYFVVTAVNAVDEGSASNETTATAVDVPDSPIGVSALVTGDEEITVSWSAPINNGGLDITEYRVYWGLTTGFSRDDKNSLKTTDGSTTELIIRNLNVNTNYFFVVIARNSEGESDASAEVSTMGYSVPGPPVAVSAIVTGVGKITVSWTAPAIDGGAALTYTVYWDTASDFEITTALNSKIIDDETTETLIDGLTIDTPYYFVITATNVRGEGLASEKKSATPTAQVSSLISTLTLTIDGKNYPVLFSNSVTSVDIDAMATLATVTEVTLITGADGLDVNDELSISKGVSTIPITAIDGSVREHIIQFRNPRITISATQLEIVDGTKSSTTPPTTKMPSRFMVFDISTTAEIKSQYSVEFMLVKDGSTAPTTMEEFRKTISLHTEKTNVYPSADIDVSMAHKSALFPKPDNTSLYLAYDSEANYPLEPGTTYTLYAVQPQSTDTKPVSVGSYTTGNPVDMGSNTIDSFIESFATAANGGNYYCSKDQFMVFIGLYGNDLPPVYQLLGQSGMSIELFIDKGLVAYDFHNTLWFNVKESKAKPGWYAIAYKPNMVIYGDKKVYPYTLFIGFASSKITFHFID